MRKYAAKVIKSCNIIDIARRIFFFDNDDIFADMDKNLISVHDRDVMKIGQLRTSFLGQGFKLVDIKVNDEYEEAIIIDLEIGVASIDDDKLKRRIHCMQFLYNIWMEFPAKWISIVYCEDNEVELFRFSIEGVICEDVSKGIMEFSQMVRYVKIEKLLV